MPGLNVKIQTMASWQEALLLFKKTQVDNLLVMDGDKFIGLIDIQDVIS